jgi:hypothetical protein
MEFKQLREMLIDGLRKEEHFPPVLPPLKNSPVSHGECPLLEKWRRMCIPDWRENLRTSALQGDKNREEYARWMLREILFDPEYWGRDAWKV